MGENLVDSKPGMVERSLVVLDGLDSGSEWEDWKWFSAWDTEDSQIYSKSQKDKMKKIQIQIK